MQSGPRPLGLVESERAGKKREELAMRNHIWSLGLKKKGTARKTYIAGWIYSYAKKVTKNLS